MPEAGTIAEVAGDTRGGGTTMLDFFLLNTSLTAVSAKAAAATLTAATVAGREGIVGIVSGFLLT